MMITTVHLWSCTETCKYKSWETHHHHRTWVCGFRTPGSRPPLQSLFFWPPGGHRSSANLGGTFHFSWNILCLHTRHFFTTCTESRVQGEKIVVLSMYWLRVMHASMSPSWIPFQGPLHRLPPQALFADSLPRPSSLALFECIRNKFIVPVFYTHKLKRRSVQL